MAEYKRLPHTKAQRHEDEEKGFSRKSIIGESNLVEVVQIGVLLCAAVAMISVGLYCVVNSSGHSAGDLRWMSVPFLAVILIGVLTTRRPGAWMLSLRLMILGVFGIGMVWFLRAAGIMLQYDAWISAGMPNQHPRSTELVISYVLVSLVVAIFLPQQFWRRSKN